MPSPTRRRFLKFATAAGLMPFLPARAAALPAAMTPSKMLWASLHSQAGSQAQFARLTGSLGLPQKTGLGIYAKLAASRGLTVRNAAGIARAAPLRVASTTARPRRAAFGSSKLDLRKFLRDACTDTDCARPLRATETVEEPRKPDAE